MKQIVGTVAGRSFVVLFIVLLLGCNIYAAHFIRLLHPTIWYYWTADGVSIDLSQPGSRHIVGRDALPSELPNALRSVSEEYQRRCGLDRPRKSSTIGAEWRGVTLCNAGDHSGEEFDRRHAFFKTSVDQLYSQYYLELANRHIEASAWGLLLWLTALGIYGVGAWILAPRRRSV